MSDGAEIAMMIMGPIFIVALFSIEPISVLIAYRIEREQRRRDLLAGIQPPECEDAKANP